MEPGRELDAKIAEKLGWSVIDGRWYPHYSTDDGTALGLAEEMLKRDEVWYVELSRGGDGFACYLKPKGYDWFGEHETLCGAIATACARALGVEE